MIQNDFFNNLFNSLREEFNPEENKLWFGSIGRIVFLLSRPPIKLRRSKSRLINPPYFII